MTPKLYVADSCPPCRAVLLTAKALGVTLNLKDVNIYKDEHNELYFTKMNAECSVPALEDNRYIIWDSHAINAYLVGKYGKEDTLYPNNVEHRGLINKRLHFDSAVLFPLFHQIMHTLRFQNPIPDKKIDDVYKCYEIVEKFLEESHYVAGNNVTIADFSLITSITSLDVLVPIKRQTYPNISKWIRLCHGLPYYQENVIGLQKFKEFVQKITS